MLKEHINTATVQPEETSGREQADLELSPGEESTAADVLQT